MSFKPILFSTEMVQAILQGRKTKTRRVVKPQPIFKEGVGKWIKNNKIQEVGGKDFVLKYMQKNTHIKVGDILWVRETFSNGCFENGKHTGFRYKADDVNFNVKWKPSLFMPKEACRLFLKVTDVRVERLQEIGEEDAISEGIEKIKLSSPSDRDFAYRWRESLGPACAWNYTAKNAFRCLWLSINGIDSWEQNPFVLVYTFEITDKPLNFGV